MSRHQPDNVSLGTLVATNEARFFVGRERERTIFAEALRRATRTPQVLYVFGQRGIGKSALLGRYASAAALARKAVLHVQADTLGPVSKGAIVPFLAAQVGAAIGTTVAPDVASVVAAIQSAAHRTGMVLIIDDYSALRSMDGWLRRRVFSGLGAGVCLVLADRAVPAELWPGEMAWLRLVRGVQLATLDRRTSAALLARHGVVGAGAIHEAVQVCAGYPALLCVAAGALTSSHRPSIDQVPNYLLEKVLHPGSRRSHVRLGKDLHGLDTALSACSMVPGFDRELLGTLVGEPEAEAQWPRLMALPAIVQDRGSWCLPPSLRWRLLRQVVAHRPWATRRWRLRALRHYMEHLTLREGPATDTWHRAAQVILGTSPTWNSAAVSDADATASAFDAAWRDGISCGKPADGATRTPLVLAWANALVVARPLDDACRTCAQGRWVSGDAAATLATHPGVTTALRSLHADTAGSPLDMLLCSALTEQGCAHPPWCAVLGRGSEGPAQTQPPTPIVCASADTLLHELGPSLGGIPLPAAKGDGPWRVHLLNPTLMDVRSWLREGTAIPSESAPQLEEERIAAAREVLAALDDPGRLSDTVFARHAKLVFGSAPAEVVERFVLDALASIEGGDATAATRLVREQYIQKRSHQVMLDASHVSRATYYRQQRRVLVHLADALFHPGS